MPPRLSPPTKTSAPNPRQSLSSSKQSSRNDFQSEHDSSSEDNSDDTADDVSSDRATTSQPSTPQQHDPTQSLSLTETALLPTSPPLQALATTTFLRELPEFEQAVVPTSFACEEETAIYRLFASNEPLSKTQILDNPSLKATKYKKKALEDALDALVSREIIIQQPLAGGKNFIFYLNQALRPKCSAESLQKLTTFASGALGKRRLHQTMVSHLKGQIESIKNEPKTEQILEQVEQLAKVVREKGERLNLLCTVASDPGYFTSLKEQFAQNMTEWAKRKRKMGEMAEPYLSNITKKQKVFYKDIGCEDELVELKIDYNDFVDFGKKYNIFDASGRPYRAGHSLPATQSLQQQQQQQRPQLLPPQNNAKQPLNPLTTPIVAHAGQNRAQILMERMKQQKESGNTPKVLNISIPDLKFQQPVTPTKAVKGGKEDTKKPPAKVKK